MFGYTVFAPKSNGLRWRKAKRFWLSSSARKWAEQNLNVTWKLERNVWVW